MLARVPVLVWCVAAAVALERLIERRAEDVRPPADIWGGASEASVETLRMLSNTTNSQLSNLLACWARQATIINNHFWDHRQDPFALQGARICTFLVEQYYPFMGMMSVLGLAVDLHPDGLNDSQKRAMVEARRTRQLAWSEILQLEIVLPDVREVEKLGIQRGMNLQEKARDLAAHLSIPTLRVQTERTVARIIDAMLENPRTQSAKDFQLTIDTDLLGKAKEIMRRANLPALLPLQIEVFRNELQVAETLQALSAKKW